MGLVDYGSLIAEGARRLADAEPEAKVILFGSHARGEGRPGSDGTLLHDALLEGRVLLTPSGADSVRT